MTYSSEVLADSPLAYYRMGEASGTTLTDSSGNGRHGTYGGSGYSLGATGLVSGDPDTCVDFTNGHASIADGAWMDATTITVEAIVNLDVAYQRILVERDAQDGAAIYRQWQFRVNAGVLEFIIQTSAGTAAASSTTTLLAGTRYHLAASYDGTSIKVYVNGVLETTAPYAATLNTGVQPIYIGRSSYGGIWPTDGRIDEVAYYGTALSPARIAAHYTAATTAPTSDPAGTLAATLQVLTVALSGTYAAPAVPGSLAATLPVPSAALSGTYAAPPSGSLTAALPAPTVALAGSYADPIPGTFAVTLPVPTVALAGTFTAPAVPTGVLTFSLPVPTTTLAGGYVAPAAETGSLNLTLPVPVVSLSGAYVGDAPVEIVRNGLGLVLDSSATVDVVAPPDSGSLSSTAPLHIIAATVPVPTLVAGRPS